MISRLWLSAACVLLVAGLAHGQWAYEVHHTVQHVPVAYEYRPVIAVPTYQQVRTVRRSTAKLVPANPVAGGVYEEVVLPSGQVILREVSRPARVIRGAMPWADTGVSVMPQQFYTAPAF